VVFESNRILGELLYFLYVSSNFSISNNHYLVGPNQLSPRNVEKQRKKKFSIQNWISFRNWDWQWVLIIVFQKAFVWVINNGIRSVECEALLTLNVGNFADSNGFFSIGGCGKGCDLGRQYCRKNNRHSLSQHDFHHRSPHASTQSIITRENYYKKLCMILNFMLIWTNDEKASWIKVTEFHVAGNNVVFIRLPFLAEKFMIIA
jgi:hypothetical protein